MNGTIIALIREKIEKDRLSNREAARQIGISHTTIPKIMAGKEVDYSTVKLLSKWLEIPLSTLLDADMSNTAARMEAVLHKEPAIWMGILDTLWGVEQGEIPLEVLRDISRYIYKRIKEG